jgi:hypothetical protein
MNIILIALTFVVFLTQLGDWYTTRTILKEPGGYEQNPVAKWFMTKLTVDGYLLAKLVFVTTLIAVVANVYADLVTICLYTWVLYHNWQSMPK